MIDLILQNVCALCVFPSLDTFTKLFLASRLYPLFLLAMLLSWTLTGSIYIWHVLSRQEGVPFFNKVTVTVKSIKMNSLIKKLLDLLVTIAATAAGRHRYLGPGRQKQLQVNIRNLKDSPPLIHYPSSVHRFGSGGGIGSCLSLGIDQSWAPVLGSY